MNVTKICNVCKIEKSLGCFSPRKESKKDGCNYTCKECCNKATKERRKTNPEKAKAIGRKAYQNNYLRYRYGITKEEYMALLELQGGVCAICGGLPKSKRINKLSVDHNHKTGKVRGLLCHKCNTVLGMCNDNKNVLYKAIDYLGDK